MLHLCGLVALLTTRCCRWLNNEQALEDSANFMRNVKFQGIDEDLTAPNTPWIYYGVRVFPLTLIKMAVNTDYFCCERRRARMQGRGRHTCAYSTLTSCLAPLRRVVRLTIFSILSPTTLNLTARFWSLSRDSRRAHELGIHGRYPARCRRKVLRQPRQVDRHH